MRPEEITEQDLQHDRLSPGAEAQVRQIIREEIVKAFQVLGRAASYLDVPYETAELDSRALGNIEDAAEATVRRLTCKHERHYDWGNERRCDLCGEPEPAPADPFASLDPDCNHAFSTEDGVTRCQLCEGVKTGG